jgi:hypothetical protein
MTSDWKILGDALRASTSASQTDKQAASKAARDLPGEPFVFNAYLSLVARGVARTEANVKAEAKKLARANERHFAAQKKCRVGEGEPCL